MVDTPPRLDLKNADWDSFKENLNTQQGHDLNNAPCSAIDDEVKRWYEEIQQEFGRTIPITRHRTIPHPHTSYALRLYQTQYDNVQQLANCNGWTEELRSRYRELQAEILQETKRLYELKWESLVKETARKHKDPKAFWTGIKRLMGTNDCSLPYLYDEQNIKIFDQEQQECLHRRYMQKIFNISEKENEAFDADHQEEENRELRDHCHLLRPHE